MVDVLRGRNVTLEVQWESAREKGDGGREVCGVRFCESDGRGRRRIWGCSGRVRQRRDGKCGGWLAW